MIKDKREWNKRAEARLPAVSTNGPVAYNPHSPAKPDLLPRGITAKNARAKSLPSPLPCRGG